MHPRTRRIIMRRLSRLWNGCPPVPESQRPRLFQNVETLGCAPTLQRRTANPSNWKTNDCFRRPFLLAGNDLIYRATSRIVSGSPKVGSDGLAVSGQEHPTTSRDRCVPPAPKAAAAGPASQTMG